MTTQAIMLPDTSAEARSGAVLPCSAVLGRVLVAVDKHRNHYIYRDWPDLASYGEWATPSETLKAPKLN
jgi:hypothetical protein